MVLKPRKFIYKNKQKLRKFQFFKKSKLSFGNSGLYLIQSLRLNSKQIFRYKLFIKKSVRKVDKTLRFVWFNLFPHLPLTRKVEGSRMGKGKGKLVGWIIEYKPGIYLFEFKNLRNGRLEYFIKQILLKIPSKGKVYKNLSKKTTTVLNKSIKISYDVFW